MLQYNISSLGVFQPEEAIGDLVIGLVNSPPASMERRRLCFEKGDCITLSRPNEPIELWAYIVKGKDDTLDDFFLAYRGGHFNEAKACCRQDSHSWNGPQLLRLETDGEIEELPINAWVADAPENIQLGERTNICLVCCAEELRAYADLAAYREAQLPYAPECLIPTGTFPPGWPEKSEEEFEESDTILMSGKVTAAERRTNPFTKDNYYWMCVRCLGLELEAVAAVDMFNEPPKSGNYIHGRFGVQGYFEARGDDT